SLRSRPHSGSSLRLERAAAAGYPKNQPMRRRERITPRSIITPTPISAQVDGSGTIWILSRIPSELVVPSAISVKVIVLLDDCAVKVNENRLNSPLGAA